jgi:hypothetical protein
MLLFVFTTLDVNCVVEVPILLGICSIGKISNKWINLEIVGVFVERVMNVI